MGHLEGTPQDSITLGFYGQCCHGSSKKAPYQFKDVRKALSSLSGASLESKLVALGVVCNVFQTFQRTQ